MPARPRCTRPRCHRTAPLPNEGRDPHQVESVGRDGARPAEREPPEQEAEGPAVGVGTERRGAGTCRAIQSEARMTAKRDIIHKHATYLCEGSRYGAATRVSGKGATPTSKTAYTPPASRACRAHGRPAPCTAPPPMPPSSGGPAPRRGQLRARRSVGTDSWHGSTFPQGSHGTRSRLRAEQGRMGDPVLGRRRHRVPRLRQGRVEGAAGRS